METNLNERALFWDPLPVFRRSDAEYNLKVEFVDHDHDSDDSVVTYYGDSDESSDFQFPLFIDIVETSYWDKFLSKVRYCIYCVGCLGRDKTKAK